MLEDALLASFPPHTHPLTLVSDPDGILADDTLHTELAQRGFRLIMDDGDPVALRQAVQRALPCTAASPLVLVTPGPLNALPYDLWQQGRHITLDVASLYPGLDVGILRTLSNAQRRRLYAAAADPTAHPTRSRRETVSYVLAQVFGFTGAGDVLTPAGALTWLARYHGTGAGPLPSALAEEVRTRLERAPNLGGWPLHELLTDATALRGFVQRAWASYLAVHVAVPTASRLSVGETPAVYGIPDVLPFASDARLQDALPTLVRSGALKPEPVADAAALPAWALPAVVSADAEVRCGRLAASLDELELRLADSPATWDDWCAVAWLWASLVEYLHDPRLTLPAELAERRDRLQDTLDRAFLGWLTANYAPLAGRALPRPHHLYHVPQWLASVRERRPGMRVALIVLDGMSLADWLRIRAAWTIRHPTWSLDEVSVLAEAPSITAISRLALVSGRRPNTFATGDLQNRHEGRLWRDFWSARGVPSEGAFYAHLADGAPYPHEIGSHRTQAVCLVYTAVDDMVHGATLGTAEVQASLNVWLAGNGTNTHGSQWLEELIERILDEGYSVSIISDHGHVEAVGTGVPSEGVIAATRGKRARLYSSAELARSRHAAMAGTLLLEDGWLAPTGAYPLVASARQAFATRGERVVTHGGLTLEEMVVPLITIEKR